LVPARCRLVPLRGALEVSAVTRVTWRGNPQVTHLGELDAPNGALVGGLAGKQLLRAALAAAHGLLGFTRPAQVYRSIQEQ